MIKPVNCGCGGEAIIYINGACQAKIYCKKCGIESNIFATKYKAIEAWNRAMSGNVRKCAKDARCTERTAKVKNIAHVRGYPPEGECSNCGFDVVDDGEYCPGCGARLEWK
jgi:hypothetical protein